MTPFGLSRESSRGLHRVGLPAVGVLRRGIFRTARRARGGTQTAMAWHDNDMAWHSIFRTARRARGGRLKHRHCIVCEVEDATSLAIGNFTNDTRGHAPCHDHRERSPQGEGPARLAPPRRNTTREYDAMGLPRARVRTSTAVARRARRAAPQAGRCVICRDTSLGGNDVAFIPRRPRTARRARRAAPRADRCRPRAPRRAAAARPRRPRPRRTPRREGRRAMVGSTSVRVRVSAEQIIMRHASCARPRPPWHHTRDPSSRRRDASVRRAPARGARRGCSLAGQAAESARSRGVVRYDSVSPPGRASDVPSAAPAAEAARRNVWGGCHVTAM